MSLPGPVENYLAKFEGLVLQRLTTLRTLVRECVPEAEEGFWYGMPGYKSHGKPLLYFAAFKNHIGLYATPSGHTEFAERLKDYKQGKGSVQFPHNRELPLDLIRQMIEFRRAENSQNPKRRQRKSE